MYLHASRIIKSSYILKIKCIALLVSPGSSSENIRKPLFISSVLGANIFDVDACGRENDGIIGTRGGGAVVEFVTDLFAAARGAGVKNLLVTACGLTFENTGSSGMGEEELEDGLDLGEHTTGVWTGLGAAAEGEGANTLFVATCGVGTTAGMGTIISFTGTTGFTSMSTG